MGKPSTLKMCYSDELGETTRIEISQQGEEKKVTTIPRVVTSEIGGTWYVSYNIRQMNDLGRSSEEGETPVVEIINEGVYQVPPVSLVTTPRIVVTFFSSPY